MQNLFKSIEKYKITLDAPKTILFHLRPTRRKGLIKVAGLEGFWWRMGGSRVDAIFQAAATDGSLRRSIFTSALALLASLIPAEVKKSKERKHAEQ